MITLNLLLICSVAVQAVRISPKLDFGESNKKTLNAGFRSDTESRYLRDSGVTKFNYRTEYAEPTKSENIEVICISGNCATMKATTENQTGLSADVLVRIKTNVDVSKIKNDTMQPVPDVPVVVGTKTTTISTPYNNRPFGAPNPVVYSSSYPAANFVPLLSTNNAFSLPSTPSVFQNPPFQVDSQIRGYPGSTNYAPRFQGIGNDIDLQTTYFASPLNDNNNNNYNRPIAPQPAFYPSPKGVRGGSYNPVEFRKIYSNDWSPVKWSGNNPVNSDRRTGSGIPRWTPCVCQNPELHRYPTTPTYPQRSQPAGINSKLAPLA